MGLVPLDLLVKRVEASRAESQAALFHDLLNLGEAFLKTYTAAIVACVPDEANRHRYRLCHKLVRAASIGEWDDVLADVSTGPASQHLLPGAATIRQELSQRYGRGSWVYDAAAQLHRSLAEILPNVEPLPTRVDGRRWFSLLVQFRNKTKHGAVSNETITKITGELEKSIRLYLDNSIIRNLPWAFLKRNLSGKYHVVGLSGFSATFDNLKGDRTANLQDGIYIDVGAPCRVELIDTSIDLTEFYYPNGHFRQRTCEWLSYISGARRDVDGTMYLAPATPLPPSSTEGKWSLDIVGRCFANLPPPPSEYVSRTELETDLTSVLIDDRHPIVTLVGRGGIGKTSLALQVLHGIAHSPDERFTGIVWLSARDIDLLPQGPKLVKPAALTTKDIARQVASLFQPGGWDQDGFDPEKFVAATLRLSGEGPLLLVCDNFETVQQPIDLFNWLDTHVRCPNKILITTRHRDFRGDYAVEVGGMTEPQCDQLVRTTGSALGIGSAVTPQFCKDVYQESEGHPYVVKVLVGEAADGKRFKQIERIVAGRDDLLDALFERTYARLSPAAKRVFLTLSNWRSLVAQAALDAAFLRPSQTERIDTLATLEELRRVSFTDEHISGKDQSVFVSVPLVAAVFGKRKLKVSPDRVEIEGDTRFLHRFGAMQPSDLQNGIEPRIHRFFGSLSDDLAKGKVNLTKEMPVIELVARSYPPTWLMVADLWLESDQSALPQAKAAITRYLETTTPSIHQKVAWERMAVIQRRENDWWGFVNTQVHIAELPGADIAMISAAVNTFNSVSRQLESDARLEFAQRLLAVIEPKIAEGDATDCSRLAWVLIHSGRNERALDIIDRGLRLDPSNEYCRNLKAKVWERVATSAKQNGDWLEFLNASVNLTEIPGSDLFTISDVANTFNQVSRQLDSDPEARRRLAQRLSAVMEPKIGDGDATDCSRLAWILIHAGNIDRARKVVERGLGIDPGNEHCLKLKTRFDPEA